MHECGFKIVDIVRIRDASDGLAFTQDRIVG